MFNTYKYTCIRLVSSGGGHHADPAFHDSLQRFHRPAAAIHGQVPQDPAAFRGASVAWETSCTRSRWELVHCIYKHLYIYIYIYRYRYVFV